jgi:hypothetical protein
MAASEEGKPPQYPFSVNALFPALRETDFGMRAIPTAETLLDMFFGLQELHSELVTIQTSESGTHERRKMLEETLFRFKLLPRRFLPAHRDGMEWFRRVTLGESPEEALAKVADQYHRGNVDKDAAAHRNVTRCFKEHLNTEPPWPIPGMSAIDRWRLSPRKAKNLQP